MNLVSRQDRILVAGLVVALIVVFARPLRYLLDLAREVEQSSGLALMPALLILTAVFLFHLQTKRQEANIQMAAARAEASEAGARALEMEHLVLFGQALGRSLDFGAIRDVVTQQLPALSGSPNAWALALVGGEWRLLGPSGPGALPADARLDLARRVVEGEVDAARFPLVVGGDVCVPIAAGGHTIGVMGAPQASGALDGHRPRTLAAAATLLAISLRNTELFEELRETSLRDGLTGCYNRTHAIEVIDIDLPHPHPTQLPVSLIMFDLDHFKAINDKRGHLCGDTVLAAVGLRMREVLRGSDLKCRYGGEEFLVLLPETPIEGAKRVADSLRRDIADMFVDWQGERLQITASFGVTTAFPSEVDADAFIGRADAALYRAKDQGRNCVRLSLESAVA
jgi:diguanylate cyclase (GGDEF)-like protein